MPPEKREVLREWLSKALDDLKICKILLSVQPPFPEAVAFHAEQAAEKSLKAYLTSRGIKFGKIHDMEKLGELILEFDSTLAPLLERAKDLTPFASGIRYPGENSVTGVTAEEAKGYITIAKEVYSEILKRLPKETHPKSE